MFDGIWSQMRTDKWSVLASFSHVKKRIDLITKTCILGLIVYQTHVDSPAYFLFLCQEIPPVGDASERGKETFLVLSTCLGPSYGCRPLESPRLRGPTKRYL